MRKILLAVLLFVCGSIYAEDTSWHLHTNTQTELQSILTNISRLSVANKDKILSMTTLSYQQLMQSPRSMPPVMVEVLHGEAAVYQLQLFITANRGVSGSWYLGPKPGSDELTLMHWLVEDPEALRNGYERRFILILQEGIGWM
jgi:hypothetical protein